MILEVTRYAVKEVERRRDSERYREDPVAWADYMLGAYLWSKQRDVAVSVVNNKNTAVKAGHGLGKSFLMALLICWWIDTRYPEAFVASTAPSTRQIDGVIWSEVRRMDALIARRHKEGIIDHKLPGRISARTEWKDDIGDLIGFGAKPPEKQEDSKFQGIHRRYVLAIGDEAAILNDALIAGLRAITSNATSRMVLVCNPTNPDSFIARVFENENGVGDRWSTFTISCFDSPNITGEVEGLSEAALESLVDMTYIEDMKASEGEDSAEYRSRVLAEFAYNIGETLIKEADVAVAYDVHIEPLSTSLVTLGVDIARFGKDKSVIYLNQGGKLRLIKSFDYNTLTELARVTHETALEYGVHEVRYDESGLGNGFAELLWTHTPRPYRSLGLVGNWASPDKKRWHNARAYWWDTFRKLLVTQQIDLEYEDTRLRAELVIPEYKFSTQSGGLLIESKDEMKKRGKKSPDFADAAIYASIPTEDLFNVAPANKTQTFEDPEDLLISENGYLDLLVQGFSRNQW